MAQTDIWASTVLMGALLVAVVLSLLGLRAWRTDRTDTLEEETEGSELDGVEAFIGSPTTWSLVFILFTLGLAFAAILFVGGGANLPGIPSGMLAGSLTPIAAGFLTLFLVFAFAGAYLMGRNRGVSSAMAAMLASVALSLLFIVAIAVNLAFGLF